MTSYSAYIPEIVELIRREGSLTVAEVARILGIDADEVRRQVNAYAVEAESESLRPMLPVAVYIEPVRDHDAASDDDLVAIQGDPHRDLLGIDRFDASVYGPLYEAAVDLAIREPHNEALHSANRKLLELFLDGVRPAEAFRATIVADAQRAVSLRRKVRITYSRAWEPGVVERVVEPYRVTRTGRGYEIDAGPLIDGRLRTYLVSRIRSFEELPEEFAMPAGVEDLIASDRTTSPVTGYVTHTAMWAVRKWSESYELGDSDDDGAQFVAHLLPPVSWRAALMKIDAGDDLDLDQLTHDEEAARIARRLLAHHDLA